MFHEVQARVLPRDARRGRLPVTAAGRQPRARRAGGCAREVAARYEEQLAPAIPRVWSDEIAAIGRDLRVWVRRLPEADGWTPMTSSSASACRTRAATSAAWPSRSSIDGRFVLRGSVDVIESRDDRDELRITDHKTGRNRTTPRTVIGGGGTLQPVIYGLAVEKLLGGRSAADACSTAPRRAASPTIRCRSPRRTAAPGSRRSRSSTAPSSSASCRRPGGAGLHVVRLPPGLRPRRAAARCAASRRTRSPT